MLNFNPNLMESCQIAEEEERNLSASNNNPVTLSHLAQGEGTQKAVRAHGSAKSTHNGI